MIIGFMLFFVMRAMGELLFRIWNTNLLVTSLPIYSGRGRIFHRLDLLVLLGCNRYGRVVAITAYAQFWFPDLSDWVARWR